MLFDVNGQALGNARLLRPSVNVAKVGRMAVLRKVRAKGYGARLLQALLLEAKRQGHKEVRLSAQRKVFTPHTDLLWSAIPLMKWAFRMWRCDWLGLVKCHHATRKAAAAGSALGHLSRLNASCCFQWH